jgi:apoptosis-inducing factor 3
MVTRDPNNTNRFVIIGGGLAGGSAAETLRQNGFTGEIIMLCGEDVIPYDRSALTKGNNTLLKLTADNIKLRSQDFFDDLGIDVRTSTLVTKVDAKTKLITTKNGDTLTYDKLLVASGTSPIRPNVPGVNSKNVFTVRDISDAYLIREAVEAGAKNIVVVGGSYIGVEAAGTLKMDLKDQANVTVVSGGQEIYHSTLGPEVGKALRYLSEENGVNFKLGARVSNIASDADGNVTSVQMADGSSLDADIVILGTGVTPNTWFLEGGVALDADGGLNTDVFLRSTSHKDIYGAGDIASFPYFYTTERVRVEHISEAIATGAFAAMNMAGKMVPVNSVPFFWTRAFNRSISYVGNHKEYDDVRLFLI